LDEVDLVLQKEILAEQDRRKEEERKILALEKEKEELAQQGRSRKSPYFTQSFNGAPRTA